MSTRMAKMVIGSKDIGLKIKKMDKAAISITMENYTQEIGKII